ncbi:hypothetical protein BC828DRAFT_239681 [Blastocladiella britannica]|nr:hypothetical protein BC828DRAFT_239681 [Blastocladiella britannica]
MIERAAGFFISASTPPMFRNSRILSRFALAVSLTTRWARPSCDPFRPLIPLLSSSANDLNPATGYMGRITARRMIRRAAGLNGFPPGNMVGSDLSTVATCAASSNSQMAATSAPAMLSWLMPLGWYARSIAAMVSPILSVSKSAGYGGGGIATNTTSRAGVGDLEVSVAGITT